MYKTNWVIENKILAGACPKKGQESVMKKIYKIDIIVNLMYEKIHKKVQIDYTGFEVIHYGVNDMFVFDQDKKLVELRDQILDLVNKDKVIYIHCLGGHGRTAILTVLLLAKYYKWGYEKALSEWRKLHASRKDLGKHGKKGASPQTSTQLLQIQRVLKNNVIQDKLYFYHEKGKWGEFSNFYPIKIEYKGLVYPTSEHAFQAQKFKNKDYQKEIQKANTPELAAALGRQKVSTRYKWGKDLDAIIQKYKNQ